MTTITEKPITDNGQALPELATNPDESLLAVPIYAPKLKIFPLRVIGDTPLLVHAWSGKQKKMMLENQQGKALKARARRNPKEEYEAAMYIIDPDLPEQERHGFPSSGFKKCSVEACRNVNGMPMTLAWGAYHVLNELTSIQFEKLVMREDMVALGGRSADLRYRPEYHNWSAELLIRHNADVISVEQVANLFQIGGFANGVGDWRPQKKGTHGMFHVAT